MIDGTMYMMATPNRIHQKLVKDLTYSIENHIRLSNGDCEVYPAPFAVYLTADNVIYVEPDIFVIYDKNKITEEGCIGAPDWIIEIVSPSSRQTDYNKKLFKYRTAGVREYWIVDPMNLRITVYNFEHDTFDEYTFSDQVKAGIYENFEFDLARINLSADDQK